MPTTVVAPVRKEVASPAILWTAWIASRFIGLAILIVGSPAHGELTYYYNAVTGGEAPEYPLPLLAPLWLIHAWGVEDQESFSRAFVLSVLLMDAIVALYLIHARHRGLSGPDAELARIRAVGFWILFGMLAGPSMYARLDIYPAVLVAAAAAILVNHPRVASALLAVATSFKLWPGLLAAGLVGKWDDSEGRRRVFWFTGSLIAVFAAVAAAFGFTRAISPVTQQADRGLQIESVAATPFIVYEYFNQGTYEVFYSSSNSYEVTGPGVQTALTLTTAALFLTVAFALAWAVYHIIVGRWTVRSTVDFFVTTILLLIVSNKVLSPQYLVWIAPLIAVGLLQPWAQDDRSRDFASTRVLPWISCTVLIAIGLTTFVYPFSYDYVVWNIGDSLPPVLALAVRNAILLAAAIGALVCLVMNELHLRNGEPDKDAEHDSNDGSKNKSTQRDSESANTDTQRSLTWGVNWRAAVLIAFAGTSLRLILLALMSQKQDTSFGDAITSWDAEYYIKIAQGGYFNTDYDFDDEPHFHAMAFFPGFPHLLRVVQSLTQLPHALAAFLLNFVFLVCATAAVMAISKRAKASNFEATLAAIVVTCAPMAIVFNMPYTEAMFAALSFWALVAMIDKRWILAGVFVTLTSFVRLTAIDLIAVFALMVFVYARKDWKAWIAVVVSAIPIGGYLTWTSSYLEEKGGYFGIQAEYWSSQFDFGESTVGWIINTMLDGESAGMFFSMICMLMVPALLVISWNRLPWPVWLFCAALAANVLLSDGIMHSRPRLLLPAALLLIPVVIGANRKLGIRPTLFLAGIWVMYGSWFSAYMLTQFDYAI